MSDSDLMKVDGSALRQFLTVYDSGSVTRAAEQLGIGQSAVSHTLDRLRSLFGDPLFVRQGRGITPTDRAHFLADRIRALLPMMEDLFQKESFDPSQLTGGFSIGLDDFQRELLGPGISARIWQEAPQCDLRFLSPGTRNSEFVRNGTCDLLITPNPPDGTEFMQSKLFSEEWSVFGAPEFPPVATLTDYTNRPHAKVVFSEDERSDIDRQIAEHGSKRRIKLRVGSFLALPRLMAGTDVIVTLPTRAGHLFMRGFQMAPPPLPLQPLAFFLVWHQSKAQSRRNQWLRGLVRDVTREILRNGTANATNR